MAWIALFAPGALAADGAHLWLREYTAATVQPAGLIADVAAELRLPVLRYGGVAFNDTFVGAGARLAVSPAHLDAAVRLSFQPIDLLPITVEAVRTEYWDSPYGLVPMRSLRDTTSRGRAPLYDRGADFAGHAWALALSPTLQARAGPVVAFSNWTLTFLRIRPVSPAADWVFEPFRGMVVGYDDQLLEHTSALLWEALDGEDRPLVRVGPALRGKQSKVTPDRTLTLGALAQWRPGHGEHAPTLTALASPYLVDPDYGGLVPNVALVLTFVDEVPLGAAP